ADSTGTLRALFFNPQSWLERAFPVGSDVIISGKIETDPKGKKMLHPDVWGGTRGLENVAKIWPIYPGTAGLAQGWHQRAVQAALAVATEHPLPEWLPKAVREPYQLPTFAEGLAATHNPTCPEDLDPTHPARVRLALDELYATQLALQHARAQTRVLRGLAHGRHTALRQKLLQALPYAPTADQTTALAEIIADLQAPRPMLRLLQGDVGSGKTLVALLAALHVMENGHQVALMAPTEILAQQLFANAQALLQPLGLTIALLVGSQTAAQKKRLKQHLRDGFINLLIGTHALVEDDVVFDKLGLVIIDEQHRFGVKARANLSANQPLPPDVLVMTATPIPRTLALTAYGDMDVSTLREKPPGRTPIATQAMPQEKLPELAERLRAVFAKGQQAYWVCPLVEESEETDLSDATSRAQWLQQLYGANKVGLLHGKLKPADKAAIMARFKANELCLLVATTVVEVGVDVPNATVMVIEHAERFGLAQLHQLRGRVGRGRLASSCVLVYAPPLSGYAQQRLAALRSSEDGFFLAEQDLELRGPGEVLGTAQAGQLRTRLADLAKHKDLIPVARDLAEKALTQPLNAAQRNALALLLEVFNKQAAATYLRAG
ncbi:MAG: ATP-dependent DNA helicase RecG, partial [Alphaproteobacteria bacterium]|nr:ATP-dependent DNA helicase RecG [Alphaproteobacteria bacterium]